MKPWNIKNVITECDTKYGSPMGRSNIGQRPKMVTSGKTNKIVKKNQPVIYTKKVKLTDGYDQGGAYWGIGNALYVDFTPDLSFVEFYRI